MRALIMEREANLAELHATAVAPRRESKLDMAGGTNPNQLEKPDGAIYIQEGSTASSADVDVPTEEEIATLRKVADKLPRSAFLVAVIELCERFAFYGLSGPFQNYISEPYNGGTAGVSGGLGMGNQAGVGLTNFFQFWCYVTPVIGGIISDQYLGKFWTIFYSSLVYIAGLLILWLTALPVSLENGSALGGLVTAMIVIGCGAGGIKANVSPLIAEQYRETKPRIKTLKSGERVVVDPAVTIQRIYMIFYLCINIGALGAIATTELEKHVGFWAAYLLPFCVFLVGFVTIILGKNHYVTQPPTGSILPKAFKAIGIGMKNGFKMDAAKPSVSGNSSANWDDTFVEELKRALIACRVFVFYPVYWVVYTQMLNNFISQAAQMELQGIPNDLMQNIDPITIIVFIPIMDRIVYPGLRKLGVKFKPITRITFGFITGALAMAYAAIVQKLIYNSGPCYEAPGACAAGLISAADEEYAPNSIHVAIQTPAYAFIGLSEIFASITGLEYAYTKSPVTMKSFVMSMFLLTNAFGSAQAIALSPTAVDPKLLWMYTGLACACLTAGGIFWTLYSKYNITEEKMNYMDADREKLPAGGRRKEEGKGDA
ncbi:MAG: peptide transporter ptr2 [Alyxoria varia]|nr:MAG: peptide transporter ptr2 [Alyxoria varia]